MSETSNDFSAWCFQKVVVEEKNIFSEKGPDGINVRWLVQDSEEYFCLKENKVFNRVS